MKTIYNEGRVVGLSAYELYVRQQLSEDPSVELPSEREWLSNSIGMGNSMILKVASGTTAGYHDYPLPQTSALCACCQVFASAFVGKALFGDDDRWAVKVTDYGQLINNTYESNPETPGETVPSDVDGTFLPSDNFKAIATEYLKIVDGIMFQPGTWTDYMKDGVGKEFKPDMSKKGIVRLWISEDLEADTYVLIHGLMFKTVLSGTTGFDACMDTASPQNGDFLGPMSYPWAVKITFTISNDVYAITNKSAYERVFPDADGSEPVVVDNKPIIDYGTSKPRDYYETHYPTSKVPLDVVDLNVTADSGANIVALYQKSPDYNGALYGCNVTEEGKQNMYPLDTAAPGQMRIFTDETLATNYPTTIPNTYGVYRNEDEHIFLFNENGDKIDLSNDVRVETNPDHETSVMATVTSGDDVIKTVSLTDEVNGRLYETSGETDTGDDADKAVQATDFLTWTDLLQALSEEKALEIVSKKLKRWRDHLEFITDSDGNHENVGVTDNYLGFNTALDSSGISSGKRLYISDTEPTGDIPDGSLGIGW